MQGKKAPCQYFILGTCKHSSDETCNFSHDRSATKPGYYGTVQCLHYQKGHCRNGNFCLYMHDRDMANRRNSETSKTIAAAKPSFGTIISSSLKEKSTAVAQISPKSSTHTRLDVSLDILGESVFNYGSAAAFNSSEEKKPSVVENKSGWGAFAAKERKTRDFVDKLFQSAPSPEAVSSPAPPPNIPELTEVSKESDTFEEHFGSILSLSGAFADSNDRAPDFDQDCNFSPKLNGQNPFNGENRRESYLSSLASSFNDQDSRVFSLNGLDGDRVEWSVGVAEEKGTKFECCICLDVISDKRDPRYGLLPNCDHSFCISCIRDWRGQDVTDKQHDLELVKSCPICRTVSYFIVPSLEFATSETSMGRQKKQMIVGNYLGKLKQTRCKYFDETVGSKSCPFGGSCFYGHLDKWGNEIGGKGPEMRDTRVFTNSTGELKIESNPTLFEFIKPKS